MNQSLARLITDYKTAVRAAVELMRLSGIPLPTSNDEWVGTVIPHRGELEGGVAYFKHGYGCAVYLPGRAVDFDFGEHGEVNGFDAMRLGAFAGDDLPTYGFANESELRRCFDAEVAAGSLVFSGYILHYTANAA